MKSKPLEYYITFSERLPNKREYYVKVIAQTEEEAIAAIATHYPEYDKLYKPDRRGKNKFNPGRLKELREITCHSDPTP